MQRRPFVVFSFFWTLGCAFALTKSWIWLMITIVITAMLAVYEHVFAARLSLRDLKLNIYVVILAALIVSAGWSAVFDHMQQSGMTSEVIDISESHPVKMSGSIQSPVKIDGDRASFVFVTEQTIFPEISQVYDGNEKIQVFIRLRSEEEKKEAEQLKRGMNAVLTGNLEKPSTARNFGAFNYQQFLYWQRIHWVLTLDSYGAVSVREQSEGNIVMSSWNRLLERTDRFRTAWSEQTDILFPPEQSGWLKSMTIGVRNHLDPETFDQFSKIGLSHILAISGLHVGIFVAVVFGLLKCFRLPRETSLLIVICVIPIYIIVTGAAPSVIRAGMMAMVGLYALKKGRLKDGLNLVCAVALLMLSFNPYYLFQIGFQLSFIVTIGLIVFIPLWNRLFPIRPAWLQSAVAVTFVAQFVSFPLTNYYFSHLSLFSWLANLILVPFMSMIIFPGAMAAIALSMMYEPIGNWLAKLLIPMNEAIMNVISYLNSWQGAQLLWKPPSLVWIVLYYIAFYLLMVCIVKYKTANAPDAPPPDTRGLFGVKWVRRSVPLSTIHLWVGVTSAVFLTLLVIYGYTPDMWKRYGEVHFIDVGQGDAILIRSPSNRTMLIDTGGTIQFSNEEEEWRSKLDPFEVGKDVLVPLFKQRGIKRLDYVVITHHDYDHIGGLMAILNNIPVKHIIFNGTVKDREYIWERLKEANERNIPILAAEAGRKLKLDRYTEIVMLHPNQSLQQSATAVLNQENTLSWEEEQNDLSVVFWMKMHGSTFLFTGDIHAAGERNILRLLNENERIVPDGELTADEPYFSEVLKQPIDVLKVAHHGSKTSSSPEWLQFWQPKVSVISAGRNNFYGHPHADVVKRLHDFGSNVYRTDLHGEVQMRIYTNRLEFRTKLGSVQ